MKGLNERGEIKTDKLYKLRILVIVSFIIILFGAVASITCWFIFIKPFEKFEHYKKDIIIGNSFSIEGVNVVRIGESVSPMIYEFHYEIEGKIYIAHWEIWSHNTIGSDISFDYLVSDPNYTIISRGLALVMLPIVFVILCLVDILIVRIYLKERTRFKDYSKISIL